MITKPKGNVRVFTAKADGGALVLTPTKTFNITNTNFTNNIAQDDGGRSKL